MNACNKQCLHGIDVYCYDARKNDINEVFGKLTSAEIEASIRKRIAISIGDRKFKHTNERLNLKYTESFVVGGDAVERVLCENCFTNLYDFKSFRLYEKWKQKEKLIRFDALHSSLVTDLTKGRRIGIEKRHYKNILDVRNDKSLKEFDLSEEQMQMLCLPDSSAHRQAYYWLRSWILKVGDKAPNRDNLVQLPAFYTKTGIYDIFKLSIEKIETGQEGEVLGLKAFMKMWRNIFPNVRITKFIQVCGKCKTCHWLYERMVRSSISRRFAVIIIVNMS